MLPEAAFWEQLRAKIVERRERQMGNLLNSLSPRLAGEIDGLDWVMSAAAEVIGDLTGERKGTRAPQDVDDDGFVEG